MSNYHVINDDSGDILGFPYEYGGSLVESLSRVYLEKIESLDFSVMKELGRKINGNCQAIFDFETKDSYKWKTGLFFELDKGKKLAVLFPWLRRQNLLERSAGVYSTDILHSEIEEHVKRLTESLSNPETGQRTDIMAAEA